MKWWIRKNGHTEGPFSEEGIRKRIALNMVGSLDRVSMDRQHWQYLMDTELWRPQSSDKSTLGASPLPMPMSEPFKPIQERIQRPNVAPQPQSNRRRLILWVGGGVAAALAITLIAFVILLPSRSSVVDGSAMATKGFEAVREAVAIIKDKEGGSGTGFLLDMGGKTYLMSNEHVVRSVGMIEARLIDGTLLQLGEFSVAADRRDLARFEVLGCNKKPLHLRESMPSIGEQVNVYGNSLGGGVATESKGFIQGVGPAKIETNAEIVQGNSGSPILDVNNVVVGVAALIEYTGKKNWGNQDTRYDGKVRRYAVRLNGVTWKTIDRNEYEKQVREFTEFKNFWNYLLPFLFLETGRVPEDDLVYNDLCSKKFSLRETGFDDMLKEVALKYEKSGKAVTRMVKLIKDRDGFRRSLIAEIDSRQLTKDEASKALSEYDAKTSNAYEKLKGACRNMILVRKEALNHARNFLSGRTWEAPQIEKGYADDGQESVDDYRYAISNGIDLMNQAMKNLNKNFNEIEKGDDDDEND